MSKDSGIFVYQNLTDFEKVLFLEHHVKGLLKIIHDRGVEIGVLKSERDETVYENSESTKLKNQRQQLKSLQENYKKYKDFYHEFHGIKHVAVITPTRILYNQFVAEKGTSEFTYHWITKRNQIRNLTFTQVLLGYDSENVPNQIYRAALDRLKPQK